MSQIMNNEIAVAKKLKTAGDIFAAVCKEASDAGLIVDFQLDAASGTFIKFAVSRRVALDLDALFGAPGK